MSTKPKQSKAADKDTSQTHDCCQTPPYALEPLREQLKRWELAHGRRPIIWEPCAGKGSIARTLRGWGYTVIATDILPIVSLLVDPAVVECSRNFFKWQPEHFDIIITNPPYSINREIHERCAALGVPFALLVPVETLGMGGLHALFDAIDHEQILLDSRVDFMMPSQSSWLDGSAQFPTFWSCRALTGRQVTRFSIKQIKKAFKREHERAQYMQETGQLELELLAA